MTKKKHIYEIKVKTII